jgi:hypothetical protein
MFANKKHVHKPLKAVDIIVTHTQGHVTDKKWNHMTWALMANCVQKTTVRCFALPIFARWHDLRLNHFPDSKSWF